MDTHQCANVGDFQRQNNGFFQLPAGTFECPHILPRHIRHCRKPFSLGARGEGEVGKGRGCGDEKLNKKGDGGGGHLKYIPWLDAGEGIFKVLKRNAEEGEFIRGEWKLMRP